MDWRANGVVTPVKDQAQCGSCWAFSTTGSVEGANALYTGELVAVSEQELLDCDRDNEYGCQGGLIDYAFQWIIDNKGIATEEEYSYLAIDEQCDADKRDMDKARSAGAAAAPRVSSWPCLIWDARRSVLDLSATTDFARVPVPLPQVVTITGYEDVPTNDESALKKAVSQQPVSVGISTCMEFQLYSSGVYTSDCGTQLDHGVLVVGYGVQDDDEVQVTQAAGDAVPGDCLRLSCVTACCNPA